VVTHNLLFKTHDKKIVLSKQAKTTVLAKNEWKRNGD
jgi:hypothetical protein